MLGGGGDQVHDARIERDQARPIPLAAGEVGKAGGEVATVVELGDPAASEIHRAGDVQQQAEVRVGVGLELLDVKAVGARPESPVDATDVVTGHVGPVLGEVDRQAEVRRVVQAGDGSFDHGPSQEVEAVDPGPDPGGEEGRGRGAGGDG